MGNYAADPHRNQDDLITVTLLHSVNNLRRNSAVHLTEFEIDFRKGFFVSSWNRIGVECPVEE